MEYSEIIKKQRLSLPTSIDWWPNYFYHFTNITNALGIIDKEWIYGRQEAVSNNLMASDNASPSVISVSQNEIKEYARLYFRPRTPTQYHNEGYKPKHIRNSDINANCSVPIFFFLDSSTILNMDDVMFSETSCAGLHDLNLLSGNKAFEHLPFEKIYHDRPFSAEDRDDIVKHRHAEVVHLNGFPIKDALKGIVCRSVAEKQTLLYLLQTQNPKAYQKHRQKIRYSPELNLFFNNGIFIKTVEYSDGRIQIALNPSDKRFGKKNSKGKDIVFSAVVHYIDKNESIINRAIFTGNISYANIELVRLKLNNPSSDTAIVEIRFDDNLMYKNLLNLNTADLL